MGRMTDPRPPRVPMGVQDALWLTMDRPNNLMVVDGVMVLDGVPSLEQGREVFAAAVERFPVLHRRAVRTGTSWAWQDVDDFDLADHVSAARLPEPRDVGALQAFLAQQRSAPLDKKRPLWCGIFLDDVVLEDGRRGSAIVTRFHHAIADGVRLTQVMLSLCDGDHHAVAAVVARQDGATSPVGAAVETVRGAAADVTAATAGLLSMAGGAAAGAPSTLGAAASAVGSAAQGAAGAVVGAVTDPLGTMAGVPAAVAGVPAVTAAVVSKALRRSASGMDDAFGLMRRPDRWLDALELLGVHEHRASLDLTTVAKLAVADSDRTVWTGKPGTRKAIAWGTPIPLDTVKTIGRHHQATVNDVLLAAVAGGLRRYLGEQDAHADEVVWMVPVNLKPHADNLPSELGNYFALVFLPMRLDQHDRRTRVREMHKQMGRIKASDEAAVTFGLQRIVSLSPSQVARMLTDFFANKAVGVLTNVPGPRAAMTFAGVPVTQVVGFAPCSGDQPMTATIFSYAGAVTVGFATDARLVPDPATLASHVADEVAAMAEEVATRAAAKARVAAKQAPAEPPAVPAAKKTAAKRTAAKKTTAKKTAAKKTAKKTAKTTAATTTAAR